MTHAQCGKLAWLQNRKPKGPPAFGASPREVPTIIFMGNQSIWWLSMLNHTHMNYEQSLLYTVNYHLLTMMNLNHITEWNCCKPWLKPLGFEASENLSRLFARGDPMPFAMWHIHWPDAAQQTLQQHTTYINALPL